MSSTVPVKRRTRAMGASPGGFKSLDLDAPTRRRNATRATSATAEKAQSTTPASRIQTKRKNEDAADAEDHPAKRTRGTKVAKAPRAPRAPRAKTRRNANSRELTDVNQNHSSMSSGALQAIQHQEYDPREHVSEEEHRSEEEGALEDPMSETDQENDTRLNKQQPTPPAEVQENIRNKTPLSAKRHLAITPETEPQASTRQLVRKTPQPDRVISNILDMNRRMMEDYEPEKPLSDCDDDEFAARLPSVLAQARQNEQPKSSSRPNSNVAYWVTKGSHAVFLKNKASAIEQKGSPREHNLIKPPPRLSQGLSYVERRELTNITVIDAISAGIDWFEKNRNGPLPTPAEMASLLDEFKRLKQSSTTPFRAQQYKSIDSSNIAESNSNAVESHSPPPEPKTPRNDSDDSSESDSDGNEMITGEEEHVEANNQDSEVFDEPAASPTAPRTPPSQKEPDAARGWASALSANLISSVLRTPASWFTRRNRARQDLSATEPQPIRKQASTIQSAAPKRKAKTPAPFTTREETMPSKPLATVTGSKAVTSKAPSSRRSQRAIAPPATPTPASRQPSRGRPDSHLPVHLRGVRYEDLPPEYQAISQHMKKKQPVQEEEEEEEVDFPALLALAEKTRKERDLKEAQEKAARTGRQQADVSEDSENISKARTGEKRKRIVKVKQPKEFIAILPPGTFGVPLNIDDSSSEEEVEMEIDDSFSSSDNRGQRGSLSKKSCLRRSQSLTGLTKGEESDGEDDEEQIRPAKKQRIATPSRWHAAERQTRIADDASRDPLYTMKLFLRPSQAEERKENRPSTFLDMPPKESAQLRKEAGEYEEMKPRSDERLFSNEKIADPELAKTVALFQHIDRRRVEEQNRIAAEKVPGHYEYAEKTPTTDRALQEISDSLLNKEREKIQKYTPKNPSSLRNVKIMSPIAERTELAPGINDPEVVAAILAISEEDIVEESFGPPPPDMFPQFSAQLDGIASSQGGTRTA